MTLPKGYGPGGLAGGGRRDDIEKMIGRRVENMKGIFILGFAMCWTVNCRWGLCGRNSLSMGVPASKWSLCSLSSYRNRSVGLLFMMKIASEKPVHA